MLVLSPGDAVSAPGAIESTSTAHNSIEEAASLWSLEEKSSLWTEKRGEQYTNMIYLSGQVVAENTRDDVGNDSRVGKIQYRATYSLF